MKMSQSRIFIGVLFSLLVVTSVFSVASKAAEVKQYQMLGASMGGGLYRWLAAASKVLNNEIPDAQFNVKTGSPTTNILMLESNEADLAATNLDSYNSIRPEDKSLEKTNVVTLWPMLSSPRYMIVPIDSPYKTLDDLKGKKLAVGIKTSEGGDFATIVKGLGWTDDDMKGFFYVGKGEGMEAYKDGTVEGFMCWSFVPSPHFLQLATSNRGARLITFSDAQFAKLAELFPYWKKGVIPAGANKEITTDVPTIYTWTVLVCREDFPEDLAYQMVKAIDTHLDEIVAAFPAAKDAKAENAPKYFFKNLHPATVKYLKEKGLM
jgi:TRAP transporter TAXI family solute receptor